jgi:GT2 family glycosyltransferase
MIDLSIIVVNWNTRDLLSDCLQSVYETAHGLALEVWVVDNASSDGSVAMVRERFPGVKLIENADNMGFAYANNQAMRACGGRHILLLNTDTFVRAGAIKTMIAFMEAHRDAGIIGCRLYYGNGVLQPSCMSFPTLFTEFCIATRLDKLFPRSKLFGQYRMTYWDFDDTREVDSVSGACLMVRRELLDEIGLLDEGFFMYSEEVDWCYRASKAGWKVYYVAQAEAVHLWGGSSCRVRTETLVRMYHSRVLFFRKHYGRLPAMILTVMILIAAAVRVAALQVRKYVGGGLGEEGQSTAGRNVALLRSAHRFWTS